MRATIYRHSRNVYAFDRDVRSMTRSSGRRAIYVGMAWEEWTPVAVIESAGRLSSFRSTHDGREFHVLCPPSTASGRRHTADSVLSGAAGEHVRFLWRDTPSDVAERSA